MSIEIKRAAAEFKFADDDVDAAGAETMTFSGYGAYFGNVDSYGDVIAKGAFARTLAEAKRSGMWPAMLLQHGGGGFGTGEDQTPIGIWTEMSEDDRGLVVKGKLADTPRGREVYTLMKMTPRPAIDGLSIGYRAKKFTVGAKPTEPARTLEDVELVETSVVTFPANGKARLTSVKSGDGKTIRVAEEALREAGFSRTEAKAILASGWKALPQRDAGDDGNDNISMLLKQYVEKLTATS